MSHVPVSPVGTTLGPMALRVVPLPSPWEAVLLSVPVFPIPEGESLRVANFIQGLSAQVVDNRDWSVETFIQVEQSDDKECRRIYSQRARDWIPEVGLGVWPDREPPASPTPEQFMRLTAGEKLRPPMYQVLRITASPKAKSEAFGAMVRFGPALQIMTPDDGETYLEKATASLLPPIEDAAYTCYPFYIPLLERKGIASATAAQLEAWFCGAALYIRESFEDQGILIASCRSLAPALERLGGQLEPGETPKWHIPC